MMGWVCRDGNLADDYAAPLSDRVKHIDWFQDAHLSTWAFSAILDLVEASGVAIGHFGKPAALELPEIGEPGLAECVPRLDARLG